jgi:hypothetical protein
MNETEDACCRRTRLVSGRESVVILTTQVHHSEGEPLTSAAQKHPPLCGQMPESARMRDRERGIPRADAVAGRGGTKGAHTGRWPSPSGEHDEIPTISALWTR